MDEGNPIAYGLWFSTQTFSKGLEHGDGKVDSRNVGASTGQRQRDASVAATILENGLRRSGLRFVKRDVMVTIRVAFIVIGGLGVMG